MPVFNENGKIDETKCMSMSDGKKSDRSIVCRFMSLFGIDLSQRGIIIVGRL